MVQVIFNPEDLETIVETKSAQKESKSSSKAKNIKVVS